MIQQRCGIGEILKLHRRRIRRIAGSRDVVFADEIEIDGNHEEKGNPLKRRLIEETSMMGYLTRE